MTTTFYPEENAMEDQHNSPLLYVPCYLRGISRDWNNVIHLCREINYKKGTEFTIVDTDMSFACIKSGMTCCYFHDDFTLKDEIRFFIGDGCLIKETFVLANCGFYITNHKCLTDVKMYTFPRGMLFDKDFLATYPHLLQNFIFSISIKSVSTQFFANILKRSTNIEKVAIYLYGFYLLNNRRLSFTPPFSQRYLAELLELSKLTINRIMQKLKQEKILLYYTKKKIELANIEKLKKARNGSSFPD